MSELRVKLADIDGNELGLIEQFSGLQIEFPWIDSYTGGLNISMEDPNARKVRPMDRLIKVYYGDLLHPIFIGHIGQPVFDFAKGKIAVPVHDPTIKLKLHHVRFGDRVVDKGYPVDGRGARRIVETSIPMDRQLARGVKPNGIVWGENRTVSQPSVAEGGIWGKSIRGSNVWDELQNLVEKNIGPDFWFEPRDGLDPGYFVKMHVGAKWDDVEGGYPLSADLTGPDGSVSFVLGVNCSGFNWEPDGFAMRNYCVTVNPGGERNRADADENRGLFHSEAAWLQYGILQQWESAGSKVSKELLELESEQWVKNYAAAPDFFTIEPYADRRGVPQFRRDFNVGDFITAQGSYTNKAGYVFEKSLTGRVMKVTISQATDGTRNAKASLECAPVTDGGATTGGDS